jgi:hypothetical protein
MKFDRTHQTDKIENDVRELNEFLDQFELRGGTHRGFNRIFNQGDDPEFNWNRGGRLYSQGEDNYQQMSSEERLQITINGEAVCEIDIRASYLTIFHSWFGKQLDLSRDPYDFLGSGTEARKIAKGWFVAAFGSGDRLKRWPSEMVQDYRERTGGRTLGRDYPLKQIRAKAIEAFPVMARLGEHKSAWATLMWQESEAVVRTMLKLMREHQVPSLPVHDSLIVTASKQEVARDTLSHEYHQVTGVQPKLVVNTSNRAI